MTIADHPHAGMTTILIAMLTGLGALWSHRQLYLILPPPLSPPPFFYFFSFAGNWTQGPTHARHMFYLRTTLLYFHKNFLNLETEFDEGDQVTELTL